MLLLAAALFFAPHYELTLPGDVGGPVFDAALNLYFTSPGLNSRNITRLDPEGNVVYRIVPTPPGTYAESIRPFIADAAGNLYAIAVAGRAGSNNRDCLLTKIDRDGNPVYALPVPVAVCTPVATGQESIAVGPDGSVFLSGSVLPGVPQNGEVFPTTAGAYVTSSSAAPGQLNAYVIKVNSQGSGIVYSTFLNPAPRTQVWVPATKAWAIAIDGEGNAYVAGTTDDAGYPTTPGAFMANCNCVEGKPAVFVAKLNASGSQVSYSTFIAPQPFAYSGPLDLNPMPPTLSISVDAGMQATVMQTQRPYFSGPYPSDTPLGITMTTLAPTGSTVIGYSTISFAARDQIRVIPGGQGDLFITGNYAASSLPVTPGAFTNGTSFAASLRIADGAILYATRLPVGSTGSVVPDGSGGFLLTGALTGSYPHQSTQISRFVPAEAGPPVVLGVSNAGGLRVSSGLAPGEIVTIDGVDLGPGDGLIGQFDEGGNLPRQLGGTAVYFNGIPAPLLYAANQQVNAIVPFLIGGGPSVNVRVAVNGVEATVSLPKHDADPETLRSYEVGELPYAHSFAVNQDGSVNSAGNPAGLGTPVTVYVSGAGLLTPTPRDGQRGVPGEQPGFNVSAVGRYLASDGSCCQRFNMPNPSADSAAGLPAGVVRIGLQLPSSVPAIGMERKPQRELGVTLVFGGDSAGYTTEGAIWIAAGN